VPGIFVSAKADRLFMRQPVQTLTWQAAALVHHRIIDASLGEPNNA
jgi:hypothetical protein